MIFDTHAHYDDHAFDGDREAVLASLAEKGVGSVVDVAASVSSLERVKALADTYDFVYGAVGLHPDEVGAHSREARSGAVFTCTADGVTREEPVRGLTDLVYGRLRELLADPKIVAVGEIGLDYHWDVEAHDLQIACFRKQIGLALECGKPIIVHSRSAAQDTLRVIEDMYGRGRPAAKVSRAEAERSLAPEEYSTVPGKEWVWRHEKAPGPGCRVAAKGIIHAYAYSLEQARIYTGLGFLLGVGGVVTYANSKKLRKVVSEIPLEYLVLETDCPYLAPEPLKGERNDSTCLRYVAEEIARLRGISAEVVIRVTRENAERLFALPRVL